MIAGEACIIGAGPAGIVLALELERHGIASVLLESGLEKYTPGRSELSEAAIVNDEGSHRPMGTAVRRQLGGNSSVWGGRCVALDPVDFESRSHVPFSGWPIGLSDLEGYFQRACDYTLSGKADFSVRSALPDTYPGLIAAMKEDDVIMANLERWSPPVDFGKQYYEHLKRSAKITLILDATCTEIDFAAEAGAVSSVIIQSLVTGRRSLVTANSYIVAAGALETTRLLMNSDKRHKGGVGNHSGKLGRFYMGHLEGAIADVQLGSSPDKAAYDVGKDPDGVYCRKRIALSPEVQRREKLLNCVFWLDNLPINDPRHRNGILSTAYLALSTPTLRRMLAPPTYVKALTQNTRYHAVPQHLANVLRSMPSTLAFIGPFLYRRYFAERKIPRFYVHSKANRYALAYHAEQAPSETSRLYLADEKDSLGMRRLTIDLRFSPLDFDSIIRSHVVLDDHLKEHGYGRLDYRGGDLEALIIADTKKYKLGCHPIGTTRMSAHPSDGVVDTDCKVHGVQNLYVAGSSVFPTSGHANPTFMVLALAIRLARHIAAKPYMAARPLTLAAVEPAQPALADAVCVGESA